MTAEQVPLAAQIEKVQREIRYAQEGHAERGERLWSAVLATLQQHERLTADIADANDRIRQLDAENQGFMREVAALREQHERSMAALRSERVVEIAAMAAYFSARAAASAAYRNCSDDVKLERWRTEYEGVRRQHRDEAKAAILAALAALDDAASAAGDAG